MSVYMLWQTFVSFFFVVPMLWQPFVYIYMLVGPMRIANDSFWCVSVCLFVCEFVHSKQSKYPGTDSFSKKSKRTT